MKNRSENEKRRATSDRDELGRPRKIIFCAKIHYPRSATDQVAEKKARAKNKRRPAKPMARASIPDWPPALGIAKPNPFRQNWPNPAADAEAEMLAALGDRPTPEAVIALLAAFRARDERASQVRRRERAYSSTAAYRAADYGYRDPAVELALRAEAKRLGRKCHQTSSLELVVTKIQLFDEGGVNADGAHKRWSPPGPEVSRGADFLRSCFSGMPNSALAV
jgi:hypothetical protein